MVPLRLVVPRERASEIIDRHAAEGHSLREKADPALGEPGYDEWRHARQRWVNLTKTALESIYTTSSPADEFDAAVSPAFVSGSDWTQNWKWDLDDVGRGLTVLDSLRDRFEYTAGPDESSDVQEADAAPGGQDAAVFVVHGRTGREDVARLLESTSDHPVVILDEQASRGRTLIEKFEQHASSASFAVVLLTADDVGGLKGEEQQPRGRQNVVFEYGFFVGVLGRSNTAVLYEPGLEWPSDIEGLVYIELDDGGSWRYKLLKELRAAGLEFDLNKL